MSLITLDWRTVGNMEAELLEAGALRKTWTPAADARIRADGALVGPVVYTGKPEDPTTGVATYDGVIRDALFVFSDGDASVRALVEDANPDDLTETVNDYLASSGGDLDAMRARKPAAAG